MRAPTILLTLLLASASAPAQEHVHGEPGPGSHAGPQPTSARSVREALHEEAPALRAVRAAVRSRDLDRLNRAVDAYVAVHRDLRVGLSGESSTGEGHAGVASQASAVSRESLATLRGLADATPPAFAESLDPAIAAAERTLGVASELDGGDSHGGVEPPRRSGGCGSRNKGHGGH